MGQAGAKIYSYYLLLDLQCYYFIALCHLKIAKHLYLLLSPPFKAGEIMMLVVLGDSEL